MKLSRIALGAALAVAPLALLGCGVDIPPLVEVRDVSSGRTYQTYQPWGAVEKGIGYSFTDIETGRRVTLTNYELRTLESQKNVPGDSVDARSFKEAKVRGGVK